MIDIDFKFYRSILWRRLPLILFIWIVVAGAGIDVAYLLPSVYRSEARILVKKPQIPGTLVQQTVTVTSAEIIQTIQQRLLTRANVLKVAERFNVFADRSDLTPSERAEKMRQATGFEVISLGDRRSRQPSTTARPSRRRLDRRRPFRRRRCRRLESRGRRDGHPCRRDR